MNQAKMSKKKLLSVSSNKELPIELSKKLDSICFEETQFLKDSIDFFSPDFMTKHDMCIYLKKACLSSIKKLKGCNVVELAASNARIKPLDSIWLLGRFYGIHPYSLNFISQEMPSRAIKQFVGLESSPFLDWKERDIDELIKSKTIRVGNRNYPLAEVLMTIYSNDSLRTLLEQKSNEIIEGKEQNPYKSLYDTIQKEGFKTSFISNIDLTKKEFKNVAKKSPGLFKALIFLGSFPDFIFKYAKELEANNHLINDIEDPRIIGTFLISAIISEELENEKNLFIITDDDFDNNDLLIAAMILIIWYSMSVLKEAKKITEVQS